MEVAEVEVHQRAQPLARAKAVQALAVILGPGGKFYYD